MNDTLVSIVVPVYNAATYVRGTLDSLAKQTYAAIEVIVVDDGSSDASLQICKEFAAADQRFKVLHQENQGVSAARNAGVALATGEYIGFVDGDDLLAPNYVETLLALIQENDADMSAVSHVRFSDDPPGFDVVGESKTTIYEGGEALVAMLYGSGLDDAPWGFIAGRTICLAHPFPAGMQYEDLYAMPGLYRTCERVAASSAKLYGYRIHEESAMGAKVISEKRACDYLAAIRHVQELFANDEKAAAAANARMCLEALRLKLLLSASLCSQSISGKIEREVRDIIKGTYKAALSDGWCPTSLKLKIFLMRRVPGLIDSLKRLKNRVKGI